MKRLLLSLLLSGLLAMPLAAYDINTPHSIDIGGRMPTPTGTTQAPPTPTEVPPPIPAEEVLPLERYYPENLVEAANAVLEEAGVPKSSEHPDQDYF